VPTQANAGPTKANEGQRKPTSANAGQCRANEGKRRPTRVNDGQRRPMQGQRRPTKANEDQRWLTQGQRRDWDGPNDVYRRLGPLYVFFIISYICLYTNTTYLVIFPTRLQCPKTHEGQRRVNEGTRRPTRANAGGWDGPNDVHRRLGPLYVFSKYLTLSHILTLLI
jgi:hypothetical protein